MPFAVIKVLSRNSELLRGCQRIGMAVLLLCFGLALARAQSNSAPAAAVEVTNAPAAEINQALKQPSPPAASQPAPPPRPGSSVAPTSYDAFRLINDRNIFNPSRSARARATDAPKPPPKIESFALVGTMSYEKGVFAFFDSSNSQYRKTLQAGDTIAGHKVKAIGDSQVTLEAGEQELELKVGMQMRREDEGPWQMSARTESFASAASALEPGDSAAGSESGESPARSGGSGRSRLRGDRRGDGSSAPTALPTGGDSGGASDVLKRLMEQRQKELNK